MECAKVPSRNYTQFDAFIASFVQCLPKEACALSQYSGSVRLTERKAQHPAQSFYSSGPIVCMKDV